MVRGKKMKPKKNKILLILPMTVLLISCNSKASINDVKAIVDKRIDENIVCETITSPKPVEPVIDNSEIDYGKIDDSENYYQGAPPEIDLVNSKFTAYKNVNDSLCYLENEKYASIGETVRSNGFDFTVLDVRYGDSYNLVYDLVSKEKGDEYISYLKKYFQHAINDDNSMLIESFELEKLQGGYRKKLLMVKCRLKNVWDIKMNLKANCATLFYIADNKEVKFVDCAYYCLGELEKIYSEAMGMYTEEPTDIVLAPGEEEEFIIVFKWNYTVNKKVDYGRNYALDKVMYIDTEFVRNGCAGYGVSGLKNCYMIPIVDHGVVVTTGERIE